MSTAVLFLYVKAEKAGRMGSKTLPEIQGALISQLCLHFRYRHFALGHAGNIHVMATGLNQKKAYGVITSCLQEVYSGTPEINAGVPLFHVGSNQLTTDHSSAF